MAIRKHFYYIEPVNSFFRSKTITNETKDWNDFLMLKNDRKRVGFGEYGLKTFVEHEDKIMQLSIMHQNGHNTMVSDKIALNRSVPDLRSVSCRKKFYRSKLPTVSVIMPFYDEHLSTLLRSLHSIINRSPPALLKEVILVNDASTKALLYDNLENHIREQKWSNKVKLLLMDGRSGLIWSRLAGARAATGDVLLFLDCHVEVGYNYLPPLLDPIVDNYRIVVSPTLDIIDKHTYEIRPIGQGRTVFDWSFHPQRIPLRDPTKVDLYETPIMYGAAYAIAAKFFWELEPDSGLIIYGGDQLEMSFKINLCGGILYESSCSRIAHLYRRFPYRKANAGLDYKARNNKRVAEIWLENYTKYFYARHPERYENVEIGDISSQLKLKQKLQCKGFSYFFDVLAPDMLERYPFKEHHSFAHGTLRNEEFNKCLQITDHEHGGNVMLAKCSHNKTSPHSQQYFVLRYHRDIMIYGKSDCLEGSANGVKYARCHYEQGNQYFRYDPESHLLYWGRKRNNLCLDASEKHDYVFINFCDSDKHSQHWRWGTYMVHMLKNWASTGAAILDEFEIEDLQSDQAFTNPNQVPLEDEKNADNQAQGEELPSNQVVKNPNEVPASQQQVPDNQAQREELPSNQVVNNPNEVPAAQQKVPDNQAQKEELPSNQVVNNPNEVPAAQQKAADNQEDKG